MNQLARKLRKFPTETEAHFWLHLKNRSLGGFKFRRQHPIPPYVVDFVCLERRLVVEFDGGQHAEAAARDAERSARLEAMGYRVIRFWNDEALRDMNAVLEEILRQLRGPSPQPSPRSRGEGV